MMILVIGRTELITFFWARGVLFGRSYRRRTWSLRRSTTRYKAGCKDMKITTRLLISLLLFVKSLCMIVSHLKIAHDVWLKLCNIIRALLRLSLYVEILITGNINTFSQKPIESLDDWFARFESIISSLRSYGPLTYSDNECAKQLLYVLDDYI
jgi:hypothetical protein